MRVPRILSAFLCAFLLVAIGVRGAAVEPQQSSSPTAAADVVEAACRKAASESKLVFLKTAHPQCGWCKVFDRYHHRPEVAAILEPYYVFATVDIAAMPDGKAVFSKFAEVQFPTWVIITPDRRVIVDSFTKKGDPSSNVGYPGKPEETAHYLAALKKATPAIPESDLTILAEQLQKAVGK